MTETSTKPSAQILTFRYPVKAGHVSDKDRILTLFAAGQISEAEKTLWLKQGGHS